MKHFYYKVLEGNRPPSRRKMLIVAPDINDAYHAFVQDMSDIFDIKYLDYDCCVSIEGNLSRLANEAHEIYGDDCSEWRCVETKSPVEEIECTMGKDASMQ